MLKGNLKILLLHADCCITPTLGITKNLAAEDD